MTRSRAALVEGLLLSQIVVSTAGAMKKVVEVREIKMSINQWPIAERPREKLLIQGAKSLTDAELLAIFLRTGIKGCTAVDLARELLTSFGGLRALFEASQSQFCARKGLSVAKYAHLQAVLEMNRRHLSEKLAQGEVMSDPKTVHAYLVSQLRHQKREVFSCLFLDSQHQVITYQELFHGSINSASVHPREVVKAALSYNAAALILAHNHPSGVAEPSLADQQITDQLVSALALIEVKVLDHIIVGAQHPVSFAERGLL